MGDGLEFFLQNQPNRIAAEIRPGHSDTKGGRFMLNWLRILVKTGFYKKVHRWT